MDPKEGLPAKLHIGIIVGEHSGDNLGLGLMQGLKALYGDSIRFSGIGGPKMQADGFESLYPMDTIAVMGIFEPLKRLVPILKCRQGLCRFYEKARPDIVIGIDAPDFNLPIERYLKKIGLKTMHYVSPSVWAWRKGRIHTIKKAVDHMLVLFPFEAQIYKKHKIPVTVLGHRLARQIPINVDRSLALKQLNLDPHSTWVAILPGSRKREIAYMLPAFLEAAQKLCIINSKIKFIIACSNDKAKSQIEAILAKGRYRISCYLISGETHKILAGTDAVMVTSGTATLEAALFKKPMVIAYKMSAVTFMLAKRLVKIKFFGLPNLLLDRKLVPEYVQAEVCPDQIARDLHYMLTHPEYRQQLEDEFVKLHQSLNLDADGVAAQAVYNLLEAK